MSPATGQKAPAVAPARNLQAERRRDRRLAWVVGLLCLSTGVGLLVVYGLRATLGL